MKRVLVTSVELVGDVVDIGKEAAAAMPSWQRHRYKQALKYTLEDGTTEDGEERGLTKPKLQAAIVRKQEYVRDQMFFSTGSGSYSIVFNIGPKKETVG